MKYTNIAIRLDVLGLTLRDLSNAVNDRLREQGRPEIHYTILSKTIGGYKEKRKAPWNFDLGELALVAKILHTDPATLMFGDIAPATPFEEVRP